MPHIFVPLLAAAWMLGFFVAAHAAHYFLTIVESSSTAYARNFSWKGRPFREWIRDGVQWPDDLFIDYFAKTFYFAYIIGIWAVPAILIARYAVGHTAWTTVVAGGIFWLCFPIGLLSSLASDSRWTPFWSGILVALFRRPLKTLGFYLLSAPCLAVLFLTFDLILLHTNAVSPGWAIALCPVAVLAFFLYARLLGRLGMIVSFSAPRPARKTTTRRKKPRRPIHAYDERTRMFGPTEEIPDVPADAQPADLAPLETPFDGPLTGYAVDYSGKPQKVEEPQPTAPFRYYDDEEEVKPLPVAPLDVAQPERRRLTAELAKPSERELELHLRERPSEPRNPFGVESVSFLFDPKTIEPWLRLSAGLVLMAIIQRALDAMRPEL